MSKDSLLMSATEAAKILGVSKPIVYQLAKRQDFPSIKIGERVLIHRFWLDNWIYDQVANKAEVELS